MLNAQGTNNQKNGNGKTASPRVQSSGGESQAGSASASSNGQEPQRIGHPNDPAARAFLREAEERSQSWNGFPGFTADIKVYREGRTHSGEIRVNPEGRVRVDLADGDARKWVNGVMNSIISSSRQKDFEERYSNIGVVFGKDDLHPLGQLVELRGDSYQTKFRILDKEVRVIDRTTSAERISLHIVSIDRDSEDRKRNRSFVVYYFDKKSGELVRSEAIRDNRVIMDGYVLLNSWVEHAVGKDAVGTQSLILSNHKLLPEEPIQSAGRRQQ
jgi:hypothetical protein